MKKCFCIIISLVVLVTTATVVTFAASNNNKQTIWNYLTNEMYLNKAAACGVMANIEYESDFNPNLSGDNGTSYGICQWHNSRWTNLKNYCNKNGYEWKTLTGQLHFLKYELENNISDTGNVLAKLKSVENSSSGAYTAGYNWCYYFERPANISYESNKRGSRAQSYYWSNYDTATTNLTTADKAVCWSGVVTAETSLYLRKGPSTNTEAIDAISCGTHLVIVAENGNWGKTTYKNQTGYVYLSYIEKDEIVDSAFEDTIIKVPDYKIGDIDMNGTTNSNDAMKILNYVVGFRILNDEELALADINNDSLINSADAVEILNIAVSK